MRRQSSRPRRYRSPPRPQASSRSSAPAASTGATRVSVLARPVAHLPSLRRSRCSPRGGAGQTPFRSRASSQAPDASNATTRSRSAARCNQHGRARSGDRRHSAVANGEGEGACRVVTIERSDCSRQRSSLLRWPRRLPRAGTRSRRARPTTRNPILQNDIRHFGSSSDIPPHVANPVVVRVAGGSTGQRPASVRPVGSAWRSWSAPGHSACDIARALTPLGPEQALRKGGRDVRDISHAR